jgi:hypothetical protein
MQDQQENRSTVSPTARAKCIARARKEVEFLDKWGYWPGIFYCVAGLLFFGLTVAFVVLLQRIAQMPGHAQQVQNAIWEGFMLGVVLGVIGGFLSYKGAHYLLEGISYFRGKPASRALVEYHDALVNLMHQEDGQLLHDRDPRQSKEPLSTSESNA